MGLTMVLGKVVCCLIQSARSCPTPSSANSSTRCLGGQQQIHAIRQGREGGWVAGRMGGWAGGLLERVSVLGHVVTRQHRDGRHATTPALVQRGHDHACRVKRDSHTAARQSVKQQQAEVMPLGQRSDSPHEVVRLNQADGCPVIEDMDIRRLLGRYVPMADLGSDRSCRSCLMLGSFWSRWPSTDWQ